VAIPETEELRQKVRHSIVFFFHPDADHVIKCFDGSETYEPITDDEYYIKRESETLLYKANTVSSQSG